jgi:hypothetical protein
MSQFVEAPTRADTAAGAVAQFLRVKTPGAIATAGALEQSIGTMDRTCVAAGPCTIRLKTAEGTRKMVAAAAISACIFVPWQIWSNERTNRETAAREIYREFLNISIQRPELASQDLCAFTNPINRSAYESYVDYLLYSAEQVIELD